MTIDPLAEAIWRVSAMTNDEFYDACDAIGLPVEGDNEFCRERNWLKEHA